MKSAPTLIDRLYRASFSPETVRGWRSNKDMRDALQSAKRFIADERMSAFMADLANEAFVKHMGTPVTARIMDSLRVQARLPHEAIWIEYFLCEYQYWSSELRGRLAENTPDQQPWKEGWLIQQHPKIDPRQASH